MTDCLAHESHNPGAFPLESQADSAGLIYRQQLRSQMQRLQLHRGFLRTVGNPMSCWYQHFGRGINNWESSLGSFIKNPSKGTSVIWLTAWVIHGMLWLPLDPERFYFLLSLLTENRIKYNKTLPLLSNIKGASQFKQWSVYLQLTEGNIHVQMHNLITFMKSNLHSTWQ